MPLDNVNLAFALKNAHHGMKSERLIKKIQQNILVDYFYRYWYCQEKG